MYPSRERSLIEVGGEGIDSTDSKLLRKWAERKIITQKMILNLVDVAKRKGKEEKIKSYWNTYHCLNRMYSNNSKLFGKYCKNRICTVCCAIRKAELINKYYPILKEWNECRFLTLTIKAVPAKDLSKCIDELLAVFNLIKEKYRKRSYRNRASRLKGIRSLECNFNPTSRKYNPHLHIIVNSYETGKILNVEWLRYLGKEKASPAAQKMRKVNDLEHDLIEIIKYGSKIFTEPDLENKIENTSSPYVYVSALDNILTAMSGHRLFERFGFNLPPRKDTRNRRMIAKYDIWKYYPELRDWLNPETGEILSGYNPSHELISILNNNIDSVRT